MAIICDVSETLMIYFAHFPNFKVLYMKRHCKVILTIASHIYLVPVQCCSTLHQGVTSQAEDKIHLKSILIVFCTEYMLKFIVFRMNQFKLF